MAPKSVFFLLFVASISAAAIAEAARPGHNLAARLEASGGLVECWNALAEIRSCSSEIIEFFLNGQADLGPQCCDAIEIITKHCWPYMLSSLGFTAQEGNILKGFCDAAGSATPPVSPPHK